MNMHLKEFDVKPRPWGIKGETVSFLPSLSPVVKSFTPSIGVYIVRLLINRMPNRWGLATSTHFLMSGFNVAKIVLPV